VQASASDHEPEPDAGERHGVRPRDREAVAAATTAVIFSENSTVSMLSSGTEIPRA
jgi:hypothetical protein